VTNEEKDLLRRIATVLQQPRNRFGCIQGGAAHARDAAPAKLVKALPHGGVDAADQCAMLLQALIGDPVMSIGDMGNMRTRA
jgi:hypothetical protein